MRVLVYGLGGVGGYIAAHLAKTGHEVTGVARGEHLKAIQKSGIKIIEDSNEFSAALQAVDAAGLKGVYDVVLFCTKSYDLEAAALTCKPYIERQSVVLSLSNGVEHADKLRKILDAHVLEGCIYILSHIQSAGVIRRLGNVFALVFAGEGSKKLAELLDKASLRYKIPPNIEEAVWKKYIFISAFAVLTSFFDEPIKSVYERHREEAKTLLEEIAAVAAAKGIDIASEVEKSLQTAAALPQDASTSMHKDMNLQNKDELETLCGYLVRVASALHVKAPRLEFYYGELLKKHH